jgi:hypothetical protein
VYSQHNTVGCVMSRLEEQELTFRSYISCVRPEMVFKKDFYKSKFLAVLTHHRSRGTVIAIAT